MLENLSIGYPNFQNNPCSSKTVTQHTTTTVFGIFLISNSLVVGSVGEGLSYGRQDRRIAGSYLLDFFAWWFIKDIVYQVRVQSLRELI